MSGSGEQRGTGEIKMIEIYYENGKEIYQPVTVGNMRFEAITKVEATNSMNGNVKKGMENVSGAKKQRPATKEEAGGGEGEEEAEAERQRLEAEAEAERQRRQTEQQRMAAEKQNAGGAAEAENQRLAAKKLRQNQNLMQRLAERQRRQKEDQRMAAEDQRMAAEKQNAGGEAEAEDQRMAAAEAEVEPDNKSNEFTEMVNLLLMFENLKPDYYKVLGIVRDATKKDIREAYKKLALKYHPDHNKSPEAYTNFQDINQANEILSDETKRKLYDRWFLRYTNVSGSKSEGGKKSRKPKSKRIRVRKTRRRKH